MNKQTAEELLIFVNNIPAYAAFQKYVAEQIRYARDSLESINDEQVRGKLRMLRQMEKLREEVLIRKG